MIHLYFLIYLLKNKRLFS